MFEIPIAYVVVALVSAAAGLMAGMWVGQRIGQLHFFRTSLKVRNPEIWELLHHAVVDQDYVDE